MKLTKFIPKEKMIRLPAIAYRMGVKHGTGHPRELIRLRGWAELYDRGSNEEPRPSYSRIITPPALRRYNAAIAKLRMEPCPRGLPQPCAKCPVGYDHCPAGCRPVTKDLDISTVPVRAEVTTKKPTGRAAFKAAKEAFLRQQASAVGGQ
jgi:hypothetical protein